MMGQACRTTPGQSSFAGSRSISPPFCQREIQEKSVSEKYKNYNKIVLQEFLGNTRQLCQREIQENCANRPSKDPSDESEADDDGHDEENYADNPRPRLRGKIQVAKDENKYKYKHEAKDLKTDTGNSIATLTDWMGECHFILDTKVDT